MAGEETIRPVAYIFTEFQEKFGIPRQSGLVKELRGRIVLEPAYRHPEALRGIEGYSHLWLIWQFSEAAKKAEERMRNSGPAMRDGATAMRNAVPAWNATVRPPRLGGNERVGVFATRSPFRPNFLGLSCVGLERVEQTKQGPVLVVSGADLLSGTPIYDIKPYLPYSDSRPEARGGFAEEAPARLWVDCPEELSAKLPAEKWEALKQVLAYDPRPSYQKDPQRVYGMRFAGVDVRFRVAGERLTVTEIGDGGPKGEEQGTERQGSSSV